MPISFERIPENWKVPLYWAEVDPSKAGLPISNQAALLIGTKLTAGSAAADTPVPCSNQALANSLFGRGSELANMFKAFFANNFAQNVWALPVAEPVAGAQATGTITVSSAPTAAGTLDLYIGGEHVPVGINATDTTNNVATNIAAAITANPDLPVTATPATSVVTLTCRWKGVTGNSIDMRYNYYGSVGGEQLPAGLGITFSGSGKLASGTSQPTFTTAISAMGESEWDFVALPYNDSTTLTAFEAEFGFSDTGRWGWMRQHYGQMFSAKQDTYANLLTFGGTRNSPQLSVLGIEVDSPTPVYEWAAAYCAKAARAFTNDPARPLQTLELTGCLSAAINKRFLLSETNTLAGSGIATQRTATNVPMISRETTTYTLNRYGFSDDAYELATTMATLTRLLRNQRQAITSKYPRHKLADDGTRFGAGQAIVTPKTIKAELVAQYRMDEFNGLVENAAAFKANLIVERDPNNPNRVNVLYPPDLINQLRIFAVLAQFRLQYDRGVDLALV